MRRTYDGPLARAGLAGLVAALVLLGLPGTSIASGASEATPARDQGGAGLLQQGAGYAAPGGSEGVRVLQRRLARLGWQPGPVDGLYGPRTEAAVARFQQATGLAADGIVGQHTRGALGRARTWALRRGAGFAQPDGSPRVRALQLRLQRRGLRPGPADGRFGPRTRAAIIRLQRARGVPADGVADARTRRLLAKAGDRRSQSPATTAPADRPARPGSGSPTDLPRAAAPDRADATSDEPSGAVGLVVLVLVAVLALLGGGIAGTLIGRRGAPGAVLPAADGVVAEGVARDRSVGRFRGPVEAVALGRRGWRRTPETRYLVNDPNKEEPFWITHDEVSSLVTSSAMGRFGSATTARVEDVSVLGYVSVAAVGEHERSQLGDQTTAIDSFCERRGWRLMEVVRDVEGTNAKGMERPGLLYALDKIDRGEASCLVVSELGRLSRSATDLGRILEWLGRSHGRLVAMDIGLDTGAAEGRLAARALVSVGSWERERLAERTRKGLAAARAQGRATGRPAVDDVPALKERIVEMRAAGMTLQAIADELNDEGVPTLRGGEKWRPSSVQSAAGYRRPDRTPGVERGNGLRREGGGAA
jgi:peptidoglycan hydrolase-like protein with peptidoglycan-binding domain/DNA invertase Pin-like site-specific DNA recombinase